MTVETEMHGFTNRWFHVFSSRLVSQISPTISFINVNFFVGKSNDGVGIFLCATEVVVVDDDILRLQLKLILKDVDR